MCLKFLEKNFENFTLFVKHMSLQWLLGIIVRSVSCGYHIHNTICTVNFFVASKKEVFMKIHMLLVCSPHSQGAVDKCSSEQQFCKSDVFTFIV